MNGFKKIQNIELLEGLILNSELFSVMTVIVEQIVQSLYTYYIFLNLEITQDRYLYW